MYCPGVNDKTVLNSKFSTKKTSKIELLASAGLTCKAETSLPRKYDRNLLSLFTFSRSVICIECWCLFLVKDLQAQIRTSWIYYDFPLR